MPNNPLNAYQLTELIRLLEQRGHTFAQNPQLITENLRKNQSDDESKLHRRAVLLDHNGELAHRLNNYHHRIHIMLYLASSIWFIFGFMGTYTIMQHTTLNFFFILVTALGINTLMLILWLANTLHTTSHKPPFFHSLLLLLNKGDNTQHIITQFYLQQASQPYVRWQRGQITHQLALSALLGIFSATLLLLSFRQYSFNWESTLLSDQTFAHITSLIAWLPEKMGFNTPDITAITASRNQNNIHHAADWASLLLGSLICYGIFPRTLAWLYCRYQSYQNPAKLNLQDPYYQNIIQQWHYHVIDSSDDYQPDKISTAPAIQLKHQGEYWAVLLYTHHANPNWHQHQLGQTWQNQGILQDRHQINQFIQQLQQYPAQLLIGVRANHVPDRGIIRTLQRLSQASQHGIIIQLLLPEHTTSIEQQPILNQWQQILQQHQWTWLPPENI